MNQLITVNLNNEAITTSLAIAEGTDNDHASIIKLVRTYSTDIEEFGLLRFEIRPRPQGQHGGADVEYAILNEDQSTLLMTYMRNSEIVRNFKKRLVKEFRNMHNSLTQVQVPQSFSQALLLAAKLQAEVEEQALQIEHKNSMLIEQAPKVETYDTLIDSSAMFGIAETAKMLGYKPEDFTFFLRAFEWIYKDTKKSIPMEKRIDDKLMHNKMDQYGGVAYFLPKGVEAIKRSISKFEETHPDSYARVFGPAKQHGKHLKSKQTKKLKEMLEKSGR